MNLPVRYSPSGSVIKNDRGDTLTFGSGARLRLTEAQTTMGGTLAIPASATDAFISPSGMGDTSALVLTLSAPKEGYQYRAKLSLDVVNTVSNVGAEVVLYLDVSVDGGTTYTNRAKCTHVVGCGTDLTTDYADARNVDIYLPLILGSSLGVDDSTPTPSIKLRARANLPVGTAGGVLVSSAAASGGGGSSVTGCNGTIHMELEECF